MKKYFLVLLLFITFDSYCQEIKVKKLPIVKFSSVVKPIPTAQVYGKNFVLTTRIRLYYFSSWNKLRIGMRHMVRHSKINIPAKF